jgi:cell division protein FtsQ
MNVSILERRNERRSRPNEIAQVEPRIAARRQSIRNERLRRWRRAGAVVLGLVLLGGSMWFLSRTALFDIDQLRVTGVSRLGVDEVLASSGLQPGDPLISIDSDAVSRRLEQQPWILSASVSQSIDGNVTIAVVERVAVGWTDDDSGASTLLDVTGVPLGPPGPGDVSLPRIDGVSEDTLALAAILPPGVRSRSASVVGTDGRLQLRLRPQGTVEFGPPTDLDAKVAALVTVMGQVDQRDLCTIRVITPDTPVVTRTPICG